MVLAAKGFHTKSRKNKNAEMVCVVTTDLKRKDISTTNMIRNRLVRKDATNLRPTKLINELKDFIIDEIRGRERLEFDHSRV